MLGASEVFARAPAAVVGACVGTVGAVIGVGAVWIMFAANVDEASALLSRAGIDSPVVFLSQSAVVLLIGLGAALGTLGGLLATGRRG
jgi:cell division protein FtsX